MLYLNPCHEEVNILGGGALDRLLDLIAIRPVILNRAWMINIEKKSFHIDISVHFPIGPTSY